MRILLTLCLFVGGLSAAPYELSTGNWLFSTKTKVDFEVTPSKLKFQEASEGEFETSQVRPGMLHSTNSGDVYVVVQEGWLFKVVAPTELALNFAQRQNSTYDPQVVFDWLPLASVSLHRLPGSLDLYMYNHDRQELLVVDVLGVDPEVWMREHPQFMDQYAEALLAREGVDEAWMIKDEDKRNLVYSYSGWRDRGVPYFNAMELYTIHHGDSKKEPTFGAFTQSFKRLLLKNESFYKPGWLRFPNVSLPREKIPKVLLRD